MDALNTNRRDQVLKETDEKEFKTILGRPGVSQY